MPEPPTWGAEWERQSFREHLEGFNKTRSSGNTLPTLLYVAVFLKLVVYCAVFQAWVRDDGPLFSEQNFKRFLVYNIAGDVLGTNATWGPLAFRLKFPFATWYNLLKPGTLTCPLVPGMKRRRQWWQCAGYAALVGLLFRALRADVVGFGELWPPAAALAALTPFDVVTFNAARGEHYGYMLVCCCFDGGCVVGCQLVLGALWFFAGVSKCGPWFKYLNVFMMPNGLLTRVVDAAGALRYGDLFADAPRDHAPSRLARAISAFGCLAELSIAPLAMAAPSVGVPLACAFHAYIISMLPFASVCEWNVACVYMALFLFRGDNAFDATACFGLDARLRAFLAVVLVVVPVYGQLRPREVPFLVAFRPYAGNWCFTWHVVDPAAAHKLDRLDVLDGSVRLDENARLLWSGNPHLCDQLEDLVTGLLTIFPHFRPVVPIVEELKDRSGWAADPLTLNQEMFANHVFGFCLGTGFILKGQGYADALTEVCGFDEGDLAASEASAALRSFACRVGECYLVVCEPVGLLDHTAAWSVVDVADPSGAKIIDGAAPYAALEAVPPCAMTRAQLDAWSHAAGDPTSKKRD